MTVSLVVAVAATGDECVPAPAGFALVHARGWGGGEGLTPARSVLRNSFR